jgi:hypothetical protein
MCLASSGLTFRGENVVTHCKKETGFLQFVVGPQNLCVLETLSLQMILAALGG